MPVVGPEPASLLSGLAMVKILPEFLESGGVAVRGLLAVRFHVLLALQARLDLFEQVLELTSEHVALFQGFTLNELWGKEEGILHPIIVYDLFGPGNFLASLRAHQFVHILEPPV